MSVTILMERIDPTADVSPMHELIDWVRQRNGWGMLSPSASGESEDFYCLERLRRDLDYLIDEDPESRDGCPDIRLWVDSQLESGNTDVWIGW